MCKSNKVRTTIEVQYSLFGEFNFTIDSSMKCPVSTEIGVFSTSIFGSFLSNDNITSFCLLSSIEFDTTVFGITGF